MRFFWLKNSIKSIYDVKRVIKGVGLREVAPARVAKNREKSRRKRLSPIFRCVPSGEISSWVNTENMFLGMLRLLDEEKND
jgi:hypothetical protein